MSVTSPRYAWMEDLTNAPMRPTINFLDVTTTFGNYIQQIAVLFNNVCSVLGNSREFNQIISNYLMNGRRLLNSWHPKRFRKLCMLFFETIVHKKIRVVPCFRAPNIKQARFCSTFVFVNVFLLTKVQYDKVSKIVNGNVGLTNVNSGNEPLDHRLRLLACEHTVLI